MQQATKEASEIFAEYTLSRIPTDVRASLSTQQISAFRNALIEQTKNRGKVLDLRFVIPLFFRKYYFVLQLGRDRRRSTDSRERDRIGNTPQPIKTALKISAISFVFSSFGILILTGLYLVKSALGIDIFPGIHLRDILTQFGSWIDPVR